MVYIFLSFLYLSLPPFLFKDCVTLALAGLLSWLEHRPIHQRVAGSISSRGTYLRWGSHPQLGRMWEANNRVSLSHQCLSLK